MMEMSKIKECNMDDCSYNMDNKCHTMAITVGEEDQASCETYAHKSMLGGDLNMIAGVGACKVDSCSHNQALECTMQNVQMGSHNNHADCMSFSVR
jgi:hypothetical protein